MKIRIKFRKQGAMKFIGHLDVMRYFQKVMRRADVDIRYSEGFSPHQIMSFAAPLGVGLTSNGEYLDIDVHSSDSSEEMVRRLNNTMADGFQVLSFKRLPDDAKNAMSLVEAADYTLAFRKGYEPENLEEFFQGLMDFYSQESIMIVKKTKKGQKAMDLRPCIYEFRLTDDNTGIFMKVSSGSTANVKPEQVVGAYYESIGMEYPAFAFQIQREEVYADEGNDASDESDGGAPGGSHKFVPLEEYGADIE